MKAFLMLALVSVIFASAWAPTAAAAPSTSCTAYGDDVCTFHCNAGEVVHVAVQAWASDPSHENYAQGLAECGGAEAWCLSHATNGWAWCEGQSARPTTFEADGTCGVLVATTPSDVAVTCWTTLLFSDEIGQAYRSLAFSFSHQETIPPVSDGGPIVTPPVATPGVGPVSSPAVGVPPPCAVAACTSPTTVPPLGIPPVPRTCVPGIVCVGPTQEIPLLGGATVPALCALRPEACPPGLTILPAGLVSQEIPPTTLLGPFTLPVAAPPVGGQEVGAEVAFTPTQLGVPTISSVPIGPFDVDGPVPVSLCPEGCGVPVLTGNGDLVLRVWAGESSLLLPLTV
jgi:hypothetical protein